MKLGKSGMILELGKHEHSAFYFDCFLSGYDREREYLFVGGSAALKIKNILHFLDDGAELDNYSQYLQLIEAFLSLVSNKYFVNYSVSPNDHICVLSRLITNKRDIIMNDNQIPSYISQLFDYRCDKLKYLQMDFNQMKLNARILKINDVILNPMGDMIDINLLSQIFVNVERAQIILTSKFTFNDEIIRYLYDNLYKPSIRLSNTFKVIEFRYESKLVPYTVRDLMASQLQDDFDNIGWAISVESNEDNEESIYFTKFHANSRYNYQPVSRALSSQVPAILPNAFC